MAQATTPTRRIAVSLFIVGCGRVGNRAQYSKMAVANEAVIINPTATSERIPGHRIYSKYEMAGITDELRNIQSVIRLTKENIDALNAKFAGFQHPPSMYLSEYNELTSKLHEFKVREQELLELLSQSSNGQRSPANEAESDLRIGHGLGPGPPSFHDELLPHKCRRGGNPLPAQPRSPLKATVRAYLPNEQRTTVQVKPGQTVRDALSKAMKLRQLDPSMCAVFRCSQPEIMIPWDADISTLENEEIRVQLKDKFPVTTSISHNFVRKTFFSLAYCESCHRFLFQGFYCRNCGYRFHQRCAAAVPPLCHPAQVSEDTLIQYMLCQPNVYSSGYPDPTTVPPNFASLGRRHPPPLAQRERSTSAPNVCFNSISHGGAADDWALNIKAQNLAGTEAGVLSLTRWIQAARNRKGAIVPEETPDEMSQQPAIHSSSRWAIPFTSLAFGLALPSCA